MEGVLFLGHQHDHVERGVECVVLCTRERDQLQLSYRALEGNSHFVSAGVAIARRGQRMGNVGAGIWRDVEARCFAPEEGGTRHPQIGNCEARSGASMFTPVNFRCINKIGDWLN